MRKLRKTGAVDPDGNVVTIPRLPSVAGSNKPPGWNRWSPAEKAEHLLGLSLDRMHDYLSWPAADLDPHRLAAEHAANAGLIVRTNYRASVQAQKSPRDAIHQAFLLRSRPIMMKIFAALFCSAKNQLRGTELMDCSCSS